MSERLAVVELAAVGLIASRQVNLPPGIETRLGDAIVEWGAVSALPPQASPLPIAGTFSFPGRGKAGGLSRRRKVGRGRGKP